VTTAIRRLAGDGKGPGSALVASAAILLGLLAAGLFVVSLAAQYRYVFAVKHQSLPSAIEAVGLDAGMTVFSLLALGLAMAGQPARVERTLIVVCAAASAGQNYAAADVASPRSVAAYVLPPLFLALVVDRVVAVARRHVLGDAEGSVWAAAGRGLVAAARVLGLVLLYALRFVLAPPSTSAGLRRLVLNAAPVPPRQDLPPATGPETAGPPAASPRGLAAPAGKAQPPRAAASPPAAEKKPAVRDQDPAGQADRRGGAAARQPRNGDRASGSRAPVTYEAVAAHYAARVAAGQPPSGKEIRADWGVGSAKAGQWHARLATAAAATGGGG
jgi:hypothetical protein